MSSAATILSSSTASATAQSPVVAPSASLPPSSSTVVGSDATTTTTTIVVNEPAESVSADTNAASSLGPQLTVDSQRDGSSFLVDEPTITKLPNNTNNNPGYNRNRIGSSKGKHLTRSHAMRESASPPRTPTPRADQSADMSSCSATSSYEYESHPQTSSSYTSPLNIAIVPSSTSPSLSSSLPAMDNSDSQVEGVRPVLPQIVSTDNGDPASQLDLDFPKLTAHKSKTLRHTAPSGGGGVGQNSAAIDSTAKSPSSDALSPIMGHKKQDGSRNVSPCSQNSNRDTLDSDLVNAASPLLSPSSYDNGNSRDCQSRHSRRDHSKSPTTENRNAYMDRNSTGTNTGFSGSGLGNGIKKHKTGGGGPGSKSTKPRLKAQGSSSSVEGCPPNNGSNSVFTSKENSFDQFTDQSGVDLIKFFKETLNKNAKDRSMLLKIEKELHDLALDRSRIQVKFPSMSSYNRMLIHRCAAYFGMDHNVDASQTSVVAAVTKSTRIPEIRFDTLIRESMLDEPRKSILKRDAHSFDECRQGLLPNPDRGLLDRKAKSFEEREEEYEKVRRRIFKNRELAAMRGELHHSDEQSWAWSNAETKDNSTRLKAQNNRLLKVHSLSVDTRHDRPCVSKSHSFGGYGGPGGLNRGDSITSTKSAGPRLYSKQDSLGSTTTPWRLSPSSSGYKTQTQSLRSDSITPSPTGYGSGEHTPEQSVAQSPAGAARSVVWAVTDMASVPRGSVLIDPQTLQPIVNQDGSIYYFDPSNLPPKALKSGNHFQMSNKHQHQQPFQSQHYYHQQHQAPPPSRKKMDKQKPGSFGSSDSASNNNIDVISEDQCSRGHQAVLLSNDNGSQNTKDEETTSPLINETNITDESDVVTNNNSGSFDGKLLTTTRHQKHQATSPNIPTSPVMDESITPPCIETISSSHQSPLTVTAEAISPRSPVQVSMSSSPQPQPPPPISSPSNQNSCPSTAVSSRECPEEAVAAEVPPVSSNSSTSPPLMPSSTSLSPTKVLAVTNRINNNTNLQHTSTINNNSNNMSSSKGEKTVSSSTTTGTITKATTLVNVAPSSHEPSSAASESKKDEPLNRPNAKPSKNNDNPSQEQQQHHHHPATSSMATTTAYHPNSNPTHYAIKQMDHPNVINMVGYTTGYSTVENGPIFPGGNIPLSATTYQATPDGYMVYATTYPNPMDSVGEMPGYYVPVYDQPVIQTSREHALMQATATPIYQTTISGGASNGGPALIPTYPSGPIYAPAPPPATGQIMYASDGSQFAATPQPPQQFPPYAHTYNPYSPYNPTAATTYHPNYWAQPMTTYYVTPPSAPPPHAGVPNAAQHQPPPPPAVPMPIPVHVPTHQPPLTAHSNSVTPSSYSGAMVSAHKRGSPPQNGTTSSNPPTPHSTSFTPNPFNSTTPIPVQLGPVDNSQMPTTQIYAIPAPVPMPPAGPQGQNIYTNMIPYSASVVPAPPSAHPPPHQQPSMPPQPAQYHQTPPPFVPNPSNFAKASSSPPQNRPQATNSSGSTSNTPLQKSPPAFIPSASYSNPSATVDKTNSSTAAAPDNNNCYEKKANNGSNISGGGGGRKPGSHHENLFSYPRPHSFHNSSNSNGMPNSFGKGGAYVPNRAMSMTTGGGQRRHQNSSSYGDNMNNGVAASFHSGSNKPLMHGAAPTGVVILNQAGGYQMVPGSEAKNQIRGPRPKPPNLDLRRGGFHHPHQGHNHHPGGGMNSSQRNTPSTNSTESNNSPNSIAEAGQPTMNSGPHHHPHPVMVAMDQHHQQLIGTAAAYNPSPGMYVKLGQPYFPHPTLMPGSRRSPPNEIRPQLAPLTAGIYSMNMMLQAPPRHSAPRQNSHQNYKGGGNHGKSAAAPSR